MTVINAMNPPLSDPSTAQWVPPEWLERVRAARTAARIGLGLVWLYEGLVLKLLWVTPAAVASIVRLHLAYPTPRAALTAAGVGQIVMALWLLSGWAERAAAMLATLAAVGIGAAVAFAVPAALGDPYGGLPKNLALVACGIVVWQLAPVAAVLPSVHAPRRAALRSPELGVSGPRNDTLRRRLLLGAVAVVGTIAYSLSFRGLGPAWLPRVGAGIGIAAGLSWFALGAAVLALSRRRTGGRESSVKMGAPWVGSWADACLATMAVGMAVLSVGTLLNLAVGAAGGSWAMGSAFAIAHAAVLLASNAVMAWVFVRRAGRLGLRPALAAGAWLLALDGTFAVLLGMFLYFVHSGGTAR